MTSDTAFPHQADTSQQQTPLMKKRHNHIWKVIFIILFISNLGSGYLIVRTSVDNIALRWIVILFWILPIIELIMVLVYIITQHPKGIARVLSLSPLIPIIIMLMTLVRIISYIFIMLFIIAPSYY